MSCASTIPNRTILITIVAIVIIKVIIASQCVACHVVNNDRTAPLAAKLQQCSVMMTLAVVLVMLLMQRHCYVKVAACSWTARVHNLPQAPLIFCRLHKLTRHRRSWLQCLAVRALPVAVVMRRHHRIVIVRRWRHRVGQRHPPSSRTDHFKVGLKLWWLFCKWW